MSRLIYAEILCLTAYSRICILGSMAQATGTRKGILFTPEDEKLLAKIARDLKPLHGKVGTTAIVRMAIRVMASR